MPIGYWESEYLLRPADLTIVGAGIVGMSAALHYKRMRPDAHVRILERDPLSSGGTTRNAGFACFGSAGEWLDDLDSLGIEGLKGLVQDRTEGLSELLGLLGAESIGLQWTGGWELFGPGEKERALAERVTKALPELNEAVAPVLHAVLGPIHPHLKTSPAAILDAKRAQVLSASASVSLPWEGMIHTGKMVAAFHRALYEAQVERIHGVQVNALLKGHSGWIMDTSKGSLATTQLAICTNGLAKDLISGVDTQPVPNRVLVAKIKPGVLPLGTYHLERGYLYMRSLENNQVLFGGGRHWDLTPPHSDASPVHMPCEWDHKLQAAAESWIGPLDEITHRWTGWLGVGQDRRPLIGQTQPGLHHAVRMGGMGVAIGCRVGKALAKNLSAE